MAARRGVLVMVALAASVAMLAGCTPAPALPKPISEAEREFLEDAPTTVLADECTSAAGVLDVLIAGGTWTPVAAAGFDKGEVSRAFFACQSKYTSDPDLPTAVEFLTDDERAWVWAYDQKRLVPCLQLLGYGVENREGGYIKSNGPFWNPYAEMVPAPETAGEWERIDRACPPSPVGPVVR